MTASSVARIRCMFARILANSWSSFSKKVRTSVVVVHNCELHGFRPLWTNGFLATMLSFPSFRRRFDPLGRLPDACEVLRETETSHVEPVPTFQKLLVGDEFTNTEPRQDAHFPVEGGNARHHRLALHLAIR